MGRAAGDPENVTHFYGMQSSSDSALPTLRLSSSTAFVQRLPLDYSAQGNPQPRFKPKKASSRTRRRQHQRRAAQQAHWQGEPAAGSDDDAGRLSIGSARSPETLEPYTGDDTCHTCLCHACPTVVVA